MPELPEVETVVRDLRPRLVGRRIAAVWVGDRPLRRRWSVDWGKQLIGRRVRSIRRRGKWIVLDLDNGSHLLAHLGMTGQLTVTSASDPVRDHTHIVLDLDRERQLRFRDIRRFGSMTLFVSSSELDDFFRRSKLGPEPFDLDPAGWRRSLSETERCLKAVLLDQRVVAGVGNIYADEALFEARLNPRRRARALTVAEAHRLRRAVVTVLHRGIEKRGASIRNYVGGSGLQGGYQREFRVYGRTGAPCPRCDTPIERMRLAGRSTHYCPSCQAKGSKRGRQQSGTGKTSSKAVMASS